MYRKKSSFIIGFHGCDEKTRDYVVNGGDLKPSSNIYDWLGNGIYFWENDPQRAMEWAEQLAQSPKSSVKKPSVVGAIIDLGNCLDLLNRESIPILRRGYEFLKIACESNDLPLPQNKNSKNDVYSDLLLRELDCAVIQRIHTILKESDPSLNTSFDSVRGLFLEGAEIYPGSAFREKTHSQICVINPNCIKGYFVPRKMNTAYPIP